MSFPAALAISRPRVAFSGHIAPRPAARAIAATALVLAVVIAIAVVPGLGQAVLLLGAPAVVLALAGNGATPTLDELRIVNGLPAPIR